MTIEMLDENTFNLGTCIKVIGVGGGGGNAINHMINKDVRGVQFICANTDAQALNHSRAPHLIQLGSTGLGAGSKPEKGREAAENAIAEIQAQLEGTHLLFIAAGMGGGTGTGAAPVVARLAREMGILTVAVVTKPFEFEGIKRTHNADAGLAELEANVDSLIVVLNDKLLDVLGDDMSQEEAFEHANDVLKNAVGGIAEIINVPAEVNADFEDVRTVMGERGKAMMGTGRASGEGRALAAAEQAIACPLLEGVDISGAKGVLVLISAKKGGLKLSESRIAMNAIRAYTAPEAHVIYGTATDESLEDDIRVTVVATGLQRTPARMNHSFEVVRRSGTDGHIVPAQHGSNAFGLQQGSDSGALGQAPSASASSGVASSLSPGGLSAFSRHAGAAATGLAAGSSFKGVGGGAASPATQPLSSYFGGSGSAAAKVAEYQAAGMEQLEIPAFLRKQAD